MSSPNNANAKAKIRAKIEANAKAKISANRFIKKNILNSRNGGYFTIKRAELLRQIKEIEEILNNETRSVRDRKDDFERSFEKLGKNFQEAQEQYSDILSAYGITNNAMKTATFKNRDDILRNELTKRNIAATKIQAQRRGRAVRKEEADRKEINELKRRLGGIKTALGNNNNNIVSNKGVYNTK